MTADCQEDVVSARRHQKFSLLAEGGKTEGVRKKLSARELFFTVLYISL